MKWKRIFTTIAAVAALGVFLGGCGSSIKEKQQEFSKKIDALMGAGYVLEKKEESKKQSRYVLKLDRGTEVADFLIKSLLGSSDPTLRKQLGEVLKGTELEIDVDWEKYAKAEQGSARAYLLPGDRNVSDPIEKLMKERKIAAKLDFDEKGALKRVAMTPLDEEIALKDGKGKLLMQGTQLLVKRSGQERYDQAFDLQSDKLDFSYVKGFKKIQTGYAKLLCSIDTPDAFFGERKCSLQKVQIEGVEKGKPVLKVLLDRLGLQSVTTQEGKSVKSEGEVDIAKAVLFENLGGERTSFTLSGLKISGQGRELSDEVYRQLMTLMAHPPATQEEATKKIFPILSKLFERLLIGYEFTLASLDGEVSSPRHSKTVETHLKGVGLTVDAKFGSDINGSKSFRIDTLRVSVDRKGNDPVDTYLEGLTFSISVAGLDNFLPETMLLAQKAALDPKAAKGVEVKKLGLALGKKVIQKGAELKVGPFSIQGAAFKEGAKSDKYGPMTAVLDLRLAPNKLDPANPMMGLLLLAHLSSTGMAELSKKDFEQILPQLDARSRAMAEYFVKYEGDKALFELKFDQGQLTINGKAMR